MLTPQTKATRNTRPLIETPAYFERDYCPGCMNIHMVEKTRSGKVLWGRARFNRRGSQWGLLSMAEQDH